MKIQYFSYFNASEKFIIWLILAIFFVKGVFLAGVFPMLSGQDETRHYITVQHLAEPKYERKNVMGGQRPETEGFEKYIASEELEETIKFSQLSDFQGPVYSKPQFSKEYVGENESLITDSSWNQAITSDSASIVGGEKLYHKTASFIEKILHNQSILIRFFSIRVFSVLLVSITLIFSYLIAKNLGFSEKESLIITAIISFQPKLSTYATNINYDALLIPIFSLFTFGGILFIKNGPNWKNISILATSLIIGIFTKGTAIILLLPTAALFLHYGYTKFKTGKINIKYIIATLFAILISFFYIFLHFGKNIFMPKLKVEIPPLDFLKENMARLNYTSKQYWGWLDWDTINILSYFIYLIWALEAIAIMGLIWFLLSKNKLDFLPKKSYILFFILLTFSLQFGVLFTNWRITNSGSENLLASPGRYFIPNLPIHIMLMLTGIGTVLRKRKYFDVFLIFFFLFIFFYCMYIILNVILPRYYL